MDMSTAKHRGLDKARFEQQFSELNEFRRGLNGQTVYEQRDGIVKFLNRGGAPLSDPYRALLVADGANIAVVSAYRSGDGKVVDYRTWNFRKEFHDAGNALIALSLDHVRVSNLTADERRTFNEIIDKHIKGFSEENLNESKVRGMSDRLEVLVREARRVDEEAEIMSNFASQGDPYMQLAVARLERSGKSLYMVNGTISAETIREYALAELRLSPSKLWD